MNILRDFHPMFMGEETPPENNAGLLAWLEDINDCRRRSAALITLAESNSQELEK